jgi:hypothetical protein
MIDVRFLVGAGNFFLHHRLRKGSGAHQAFYPRALGAFSPAVNLPGREADHSPPSGAEIKKSVYSYTSTPQYVFIT